MFLPKFSMKILDDFPSENRANLQANSPKNTAAAVFLEKIEIRNFNFLRNLLRKFRVNSNPQKSSEKEQKIMLIFCPFFSEISEGLNLRKKLQVIFCTNLLRKFVPNGINAVWGEICCSKFHAKLLRNFAKNE